MYYASLVHITENRNNVYILKVTLNTYILSSIYIEWCFACLSFQLCTSFFLSQSGVLISIRAPIVSSFSSIFSRKSSSIRWLAICRYIINPASSKRFQENKKKGKMQTYLFRDHIKKSYDA